MAYKVSISISNFAQGGFYVDTNQDYSSQSEIRTAWIPVPAAPLSVTVLSDYQWSFVAGNNNNFSRLDESFGYKPSGQVIDTSAYSWINSLRIELHSSSLSPPQSATIELICENAWYMSEDGYPRYSLFPELPSSAMTKPYPKALWRIGHQINSDYPYHELLPEVPLLGAFANATNLRTVRIPETVKTIGRYAFRNTQLTSVTIASDCEYYDTSFPDGCIINFY